MIEGGQDMIDFIIALVMGGIIGWLASIVMRTDAQQGIFLNIIVGCIGSILGRLLLGGLIGGGPLSAAAFDWRTPVNACIGAIFLPAILNLVRRARVRSPDRPVRLTPPPTGPHTGHAGPPTTPFYLL